MGFSFAQTSFSVIPCLSFDSSAYEQRYFQPSQLQLTASNSEFDEWLLEHHQRISVDLLIILLFMKKNAIGHDLSFDTINNLLKHKVDERKLMVLLHSQLWYREDSMSRTLYYLASFGYSLKPVTKVLNMMSLVKLLREATLQKVMTKYCGEELLTILKGLHRNHRIRPSQKTISLLISKHNSEDACKVFLQKFPKTVLGSTNWVEAYKLNYSHEMLASLLILTKNDPKLKSPFKMMSKDIPEDLYILFICRYSTKIGVDDIIHAMDQNFNALSLRIMIRKRFNKWTADEIQVIRARANELAYPLSFIEWLDGTFPATE